MAQAQTWPTRQWQTGELGQGGGGTCASSTMVAAAPCKLTEEEALTCELCLCPARVARSWMSMFMNRRS